MDSNNVFQKLADAETNPQGQPQVQNQTAAPQPSAPQPQPQSGNVFEAMASEENRNKTANTTAQPTATISAIKPPAHIGEALEQWADNVASDLKYGTDITGVGTVLKKMGAHGVYAGNPEAVGDFMASLPLGTIKALRGAGKLAQGKVASGTKDIASGVGQAVTIPAAFVAPEESALSKEGLLNDAASAASKASDSAIATAKAVGGRAIDAAKNAEKWAKANPLKAIAVEGIAHELGIDPIQLTHKIVKYGKGLFGTS